MHECTFHHTDGANLVMKGVKMFLYFYPIEVTAKQQQYEREVRQWRLVRLALRHVQGRASHHDNVLVRFGGWLVMLSERLEARYNSQAQTALPIKSTARAR
jgi:hypothetical protein